MIRLFLVMIILALIIKLKLKVMEKKLFAIEYGNVILVVRPNGGTVIATEAAELVLNNAVMEQIVRNSGAYKSFVATKDDVVAGLERDNAELQNEIAGLKEELEHTKADKDKPQKELGDIADSAIQPMAKGYAVNIGNLAQGTLGHLFDIDGNFIANYGTGKRAKQVQYVLQEGKVSLDVTIEILVILAIRRTKLLVKQKLTILIGIIFRFEEGLKVMRMGIIVEDDTVVPVL